MTKQDKNVSSRRELLSGALRWATLGLLTVAGTAAVTGKGKSWREGKCIGNKVGMTGCRGCGVFEKCGLPQALSVRSELKRSNDGAI